MKHLPVVICTAFIAIFLISCKKDGRNKLTPYDLKGEWELEQASGDMPTKNFAPGSGNLAKFTNTSFEFYKDGSLVKSGKYTIVTDKTVVQNVCQTIEPGKFTSRIVYDNDYNSQKVFIDIIDGKLNVISGCFATDGGFLLIYGRHSSN